MRSTVRLLRKCLREIARDEPRPLRQIHIREIGDMTTHVELTSDGDGHVMVRFYDADAGNYGAYVEVSLHGKRLVWSMMSYGKNELWGYDIRDLPHVVAEYLAYVLADEFVCFDLVNEVVVRELTDP